MSQEYLIQEETLVGIADAIRSKTGGSEAITVSNMSSEIRDIVVNYEESEATNKLISRTMTEYSSDTLETIGDYAFTSCSSLTTVSFPTCTSIGTSAFYNCRQLSMASFPACSVVAAGAFLYCFNLTSVSFPVCTNIYTSGFYGCSKLTIAHFSKCTAVPAGGFGNCSKLTTANFPECSIIYTSAFVNCYSLTTVSFPICTTISNSAFYNCSGLTSVSFPACTTIGGSAFAKCSKLTMASFPMCENIGSSAFQSCRTLSSLTLGASTVCALSNSRAFSSTPYAGYSTYFSGTPYIYVPSSLVASYKTATNWTYFSSYISAIGSGGSGELINFTIMDTEFQAEEGMTWGEWIASDYSHGGFEEDGKNVRSVNLSNYCVYDPNSAQFVILTDTIQANMSYSMEMG